MMAITLAARSSLADHYQVPTGSMQPTVEVGDRIAVAKASYGLRLPFSDVELIDRAGPERGEVVVLESPENGIVLLKRVAAVPGDRVEVRGGRLLLDGVAAPIEADGGELWERLGERRHRVLLGDGGGPDYGPAVLGPGQYLVLGDNRGDSHDGRSFGLVSAGAFLGRAVGVYWRHAPVWRDL